MNGDVETPPPVPDHQLLRRIGRGAYGDVWLARSALGAYRAVKVIYRKSFEDSRPFEREFNGIRKFEPVSRLHEGLVDILQAGRQEDCFYYVMELADDAAVAADVSPQVTSSAESAFERVAVLGNVSRVLTNTATYAPRTLRADLKLHGRLPAKECVRVGLMLTSALAHLHKHGLVHRDIKPSNIIFVQGVPKLADIGLVTDADTTFSYVGTEGYIPPEGPGAAQADIFSLGKVLYEICTGMDRRNFPDLPPDLNTWSDQTDVLEMNEVLVKACAREVGTRYQTCQEMHEDLALLERGQSVRRHRCWKRRWSLVKMTGLLTLGLSFIKRAGTGHTPDPEAERLYKLGRWHYNKVTPEDHRLAIQYLNDAIVADPKFVEPYRELVALYPWAHAGAFASPEEQGRGIKDIADRLLAMDPNFAEGHTALSWWHFLQRNWRGAQDEIVRAITLDPNYAIARDFYAFYLAMLGRTDEAQLQAERSLKLDPTARAAAMIAAWPFITARRFAQAGAQLQKAVKLDKNFPQVYNWLGTCYEAQSEYDEAIEAYRTLDLLSGLDPSRIHADYSAMHEALKTHGPRGYWQTWIDLARVEELLREADRGFFKRKRGLPRAYAWFGEKDKAIDELEKQFDYFGHQLKFDPTLQSLQEHPRFKELLKKAGFEQ
jgi:serine/threonine protein kinase